MNGRMKSLEHRTTDCCRSQRELLAILEDDEGKAGAINLYGPAYNSGSILNITGEATKRVFGR